MAIETAFGIGKKHIKLLLKINRLFYFKLVILPQYKKTDTLKYYICAHMAISVI